jgi:hypothetical protein
MMDAALHIHVHCVPSQLRFCHVTQVLTNKVLLPCAQLVNRRDGHMAVSPNSASLLIHNREQRESHASGGLTGASSTESENLDVVMRGRLHGSFAADVASQSSQSPKACF